MKEAAKALEFERAAALRDQGIELRQLLIDDTAIGAPAV
ncbi:MAG: UvrB/UvrC motif-containing protein [Dehalococcoidia bacterium]|nr:UvrB/UvrC motif-containing protein [Dehalococcoidia bacterium]